jgi:hypothetical protein
MMRKNKMLNKLYGIAAGAALFGLACSAQASLLNTTVTVENIFAGESFEGPTTELVTGETEFLQFGELWDIDIGATSIRFFNQWLEADEDVLEFDDIYIFTGLKGQGGGNIGAVSLVTEGTPFSLTPTATFTDDSVSIRFLQDDYSDESSELLVNLTLLAPVPVPEPSTLALFGLGLAGLSFARRKKRVSVN